MKRKIRAARTAVALAAAMLLTMTISAAAEPGSAKDPLVTLSYLNDTYLDTIMEQVDARIRQTLQRLQERPDKLSDTAKITRKE